MSRLETDLNAAAQAGLITEDQAKALAGFLSQRRAAQQEARFRGTHVLYYLGGTLAIGAITIFSTLAIESGGPSVLFFLSTLYAIGSAALASWFEKRQYGVPAGIFATLALALTPLIVFALQHMVGLWDGSSTSEHYRDFHVWIDWRWVFMELATLVVGALLLRRFRYPFLVMPIAWVLWYMGMDFGCVVLMRLHGDIDYVPWGELKVVCMVWGLLMLVVAFVVDVRSRFTKDYAFWLYLFGLMSFWGALSSMGSGDVAGKFIYLAINIALVLLGAMLVRRAFAIFGGIGATTALGVLSYDYFNDSLAFTFALSVLGFALIGCGIWWSKHEAQIAARLRTVLPASVAELLEARSVDWRG